MNRFEVVQTIKHVGSEFGRVMACLQDERYAAGYKQAVQDMASVFEYGPVVQRPKTKKIVLFGGTKVRKHERP